MEFEDMAKTHTCARVPHTSHHEPSVELQQSLPSQAAAISPFVEQLMQFIAKFRQVDGSEFDIELALHEALTNAVLHGNQEDPCKRVYVVCRCGADGEVSLTIRDQGKGFDRDAVPNPTAPENRLSTHGRGIYLMQSLMDEVSFEVGGAVVHMRKGPNATSAAQSQSSRLQHHSEP